MMRYKGYIGLPTVDVEAGVIRGHVINIRDTITFQGATPAEAEAAFRDSVDDYLEFCAERGESPDKPFSGKLLIRTRPSVHRDITAAARIRGVTVNALAGRLLEIGARKVMASHRAGEDEESPPPSATGVGRFKGVRSGRVAAKESEGGTVAVKESEGGEFVSKKADGRSGTIKPRGR